MNKSIKVGTRGSILAKTQSQWVIDKLTQSCPGLDVEIITIKTTGDIKVDEALPRTLGKGLFTREIEDALLAGEIDLAVHSLKDLPTVLPDGLEVGAIPERENPFDALIGKNIEPPKEITIGTSSLRRASQLRALYKNCKVVDLRGNLDTRIRKTNEGVIDSAVVAVAGLNRLSRNDVIIKTFEPNEILPAPAQGALAIETRKDDSTTKEIIRAIHCKETELCVSAERTFQHELGGGCQVPVAALATISDNILNLEGRVISLDGSQIIRGTVSGPTENAEQLGTQLSSELSEKGAGTILEEIRNYLEGKENE